MVFIRNSPCLLIKVFDGHLLLLKKNISNMCNMMRKKNLKKSQEICVMAIGVIFFLSSFFPMF